MSSRSRSRSGSRSPKRYRSRNTRDDSISPIRTASGANLRTPKSYNSGYRNYNQGYQQRNYNYNNRGYQNQRYNNYGRWNRGRGNFRGHWHNNNRNQWNNNNRGRFNSRSDRSRSRSHSRSYDSRDRSRSASYSRSRSHSRSLSPDKENRRRARSRSAESNDRSKSRSKSKTPATSKQEAPKEVVKSQETSGVSVEMMIAQPPPKEAEIKAEEEEPHFATSGAFTRSRWETPEASPSGKDNQTVNMELEEDKIFDEWDDDKLREHVLKTTAKKMGKGLKMLTEGTGTDKPVTKRKKRKKSNSNADSPTKEPRGRKKKRGTKPSRLSSGSSSSSSWSPIHKAPDVRMKIKKKSSASKLMDEYTPFPPDTETQQDFTPATSQIYSQMQAFSMSDERTQAVQYPFSHIRKPAIPSEPVPPAPTQLYQPPIPVPPPRQPQHAAPPTLGEMQILGPDGTPMRLVPTSVPGPDGKMIQVMQIQPSVGVVPVSVNQSKPPPPAPPTQTRPIYKAPPPPPAYPPPTHHTGFGKCLPQVVPQTESVEVPASYEQQRMSHEPQRRMQLQTEHHQIALDSKPPCEKPSVKKMISSLLPHVGVVPTVKNVSQEPSDRALSLKKMEMMEKQKRRQEVVRTRFNPRPAGTWAEEAKKERREDVEDHSHKDERSAVRSKQEAPVFPSYMTDQNNPTFHTYETVKEEYSIPKSSAEQKITAITNITSGRDFKTQLVPVTVSGHHHVTEPQHLGDGVTQQQPNVEKNKSATLDTNSPGDTGYPTMPLQLAAQGFRPVQGNPQLLMGPSGEMLQLMAVPQPPLMPQRPPALPNVPDTSASIKRSTNEQNQWESAADGFIHKKQEKPVSRKEESSDGDIGKNSSRKRTVSGRSEKKAKKKVKPNCSISTEETGEEEEPVKRKKEKKKRKKNKKKKEEESGTPAKEKKKKKKQKKTETVSLEHETIKSKKDLKAFEEVKKKSEKDGLIRTISDDLPLSHIRGMVPRNKVESLEPLLRYVDSESHTKGGLATSTSYEDRFVSLFGSGDTEPAESIEEKIDITNKMVRKFKVHVKGTRNVTHMTSMSLTNRVKQSGEEEEPGSSQKVSLNVSSLSKVSRSRSSSASSESHEKSKRKRKSKSSSRSKSRSKSRSVSLPLAYSTVDDKSGRNRSHTKEYPDDDLRNDLERRKAAKDNSRSRSRSRSYSPDDDRHRNRGQQRQMHYNRNNQGYYYNNRGRGQFNTGYYQNYRGTPWRNNNRGGNYRGRWQNWNNQGYNNNRNQNYQRYQRYDNRPYRERSYERDRSRSRSSDDSRSSRERDDNKGKQNDDNLPQETTEQQQHQPLIKDNKQEVTINVPTSNGNVKKMRKPSPDQWGHDMFEEREMEGVKPGAGN